MLQKLIANYSICILHIAPIILFHWSNKFDICKQVLHFFNRTLLYKFPVYSARRRGEVCLDFAVQFYRRSPFL